MTDLLGPEFHQATPDDKRRITRQRWLNFAVHLAAAGIFAICVISGKWRFVSAAPTLTVYWTHLDGQVSEADGRLNRITLKRPGIFQSQRLVKSDTTVTGMATALFERTDGPKTMTMPDGRVVTADRAQFLLAMVPEEIEEGTHLRTRVWELPRYLPPGDYTYRVVLRFCNPLRCDSVNLPEVEVRLEDGGGQ